jgi:predicted GNAT family acetyltransferase
VLGERIGGQVSDMDPATDPTVRRDDDRSRYELLVDGGVVGIADFHLDGDRVVMPHTVVDPSRRGQGLASVLVRAALDDVRAQGRTVVPACWYVAQFLDEHPDYADLRAA